MSENRFWLYVWLSIGASIALVCGVCAPACERITYEDEVTRRLCIEHAGTWSDSKCVNPKASP